MKMPRIFTVKTAATLACAAAAAALFIAIFGPVVAYGLFAAAFVAGVYAAALQWAPEFFDDAK